MYLRNRQRKNLTLIKSSIPIVTEAQKKPAKVVDRLTLRKLQSEFHQALKHHSDSIQRINSAIDDLKEQIHKKRAYVRKNYTKNIPESFSLTKEQYENFVNAMTNIKMLEERMKAKNDAPVEPPKVTEKTLEEKGNIVKKVIEENPDASIPKVEAAVFNQPQISSGNDVVDQKKESSSEEERIVEQELNGMEKSIT